MNSNNTLDCLEAKWRNYIEEQRHYIYKNGSCFRVIRSCNANKKRYRWLLLIGWGLMRTLGKSKLSDIRQHLKQAKLKKEAAYLVVGFVQEPRRIIVLPARAVLKSRYIRSDKGGIVWSD